MIEGKLGNAKEAEEFLNIIKDYAYSIRHCRWVYFPMLRIRRRNGYEIEVIHLGCCSKRQGKKLAALGEKLKKRFKNAGIRPLSIEELRNI